MATPPKKPTDGTTKPPAPRKPATPRKTAVRKTAASSAPAAAERKPSVARKPPAEKPASAPKTAAQPKTAAKPAKVAEIGRSATAKAFTTAKAAVTGDNRKWGVAAVVGAVGAALTAGLLALKGSTPAKDDLAKPNKGKKAHQADGKDSSKSFEAGIADEGTIPE